MEGGGRGVEGRGGRGYSLSRGQGRERALARADERGDLSLSRGVYFCRRPPDVP
jgi:hypothetical protein